MPSATDSVPAESDLLATLRWLIEAGADEAISETPVDRFVSAEPLPEPAAPVAGQLAAPNVAAPPAAPAPRALQTGSPSSRAAAACFDARLPQSQSRHAKAV